MRRKNTKLKRRKLRKTRKQKKFRGGVINPFYEVGTAVSSLGSAIQSSMSSFFVPPTPTNIPSTLSPNPANQYVYGPVIRSASEIYHKI